MREEFQTANLTLSEVGNKDEVRWEAPVAPWYKVNSDAAIFTSNNSTGLGAIIRDHGRHVEAALSKSLPFPLEPLEGLKLKHWRRAYYLLGMWDFRMFYLNVSPRLPMML